MGAADVQGYHVGLVILLNGLVCVGHARVAHDHRALQRLLVVDLTQAGFALLDRL